MQLSKNFTLQELTVTNKPIPNIPSSQEIGNLTQLAGILEPSWVHLGLASKPRQQNLIYDGVSYVTA